MENSSEEIEPKVDQITCSMQEVLKSFRLTYSKDCSIYKVPEFIRREREECYRPLVMSIGPIHYKDPRLETMQELKWMFLDCFLQHTRNACPILEHYVNLVSEHESAIRACYQEDYEEILSNEFIEMVVLDATFIIYYFMYESNEVRPIPYIKKKLQGLIPYLEGDLYLLENQLPFFVRKGIYDIAFGNGNPSDFFIHLALKHISTSTIIKENAVQDIIQGKKFTDESCIAHLLDLRRMCCCLSLNLPSRKQKQRNQKKSKSCIHKVASRIYQLCYGQNHLDEETDSRVNLSYSAKKLRDAGVKFVEGGISKNALDITFANGKLEIPNLVLDDTTEPILRSFLFFEQCHYCRDSYFIDYIFFLDELIDTVEDVQILVRNKILINDLGNEEAVVNLFNRMGNNLNLLCHYYYSDVCCALNDYASSRRHKWKATLKARYFRHPWATISVFGAVLLFLLTLLQTIAAFTR